MRGQKGRFFNDASRWLDGCLRLLSSQESFMRPKTTFADIRLDLLPICCSSHHIISSVTTRANGGCRLQTTSTFCIANDWHRGVCQQLLILHTAVSLSLYPLPLSSPSILSLPFPCLSIDDRSRELVSSPPQGSSFAMLEASRAVSIGKIYNLLCLKWPGIVMSSISEPRPPSHEYMFMLSALLTPM